MFFLEQGSCSAALRESLSFRREFAPGQDADAEVNSGSEDNGTGKRIKLTRSQKRMRDKIDWGVVHLGQAKPTCYTIELDNGNERVLRCCLRCRQCGRWIQT